MHVLAHLYRNSGEREEEKKTLRLHDTRASVYMRSLNAASTPSMHVRGVDSIALMDGVNHNRQGVRASYGSDDARASRL